VARIPGRSLWLSAPVGLLCAAVVAALVWLAAPMVPTVVTWAGDTLRAATARAEAAAPDDPLVAALAGEAPLDCRDIYPDDLWRQLAWFPGALLAQSAAVPEIAAPPLVEALAPDIRISCRWHTRDGATLQTALATVAPDAVAAGEAALRAAGFACTAAAPDTTCSRTTGDFVETHVFRDGWWLVSVEGGWHPEDYAGRIAARLWG
jgi:hypothetical protein